MIGKPFQKYSWTSHAHAKMRFYGLSESRIRRVIHSPLRIEEGIAPDTIAVMQPSTHKGIGAKKTWTQEIWVMYAIESAKQEKKFRIISSWRYPGKTKPKEALPESIMIEIREALERT